MKKLFVLAAMLSVVLLSGCAAPNALSKMSEVETSQGAVIAKVTVFYNGEDITHTLGLGLLMDRRGPYGGVTAGANYPFFPDEAGYIYGRFSKEKKITVDTITARQGMVRGNFGTEGKDDLFFQVSNDGPTYLGDIEIHWIGPGALAKLFTIEPAMMVRNRLMRKDMDVAVSSNLAAAQAAFNKKYNTNVVLHERLATVIKRKNPIPIYDEDEKSEKGVAPK